MQAPSASTLTLFALIPLIAWRVYSRFRRLVGRQRLSKVRPWITLAIFPVLLVLLGFAAHAHLERLWWLAGGLGLGALLGMFGLRKTRFERVGSEFFYTPNAHIGVLVSLLFVGRLLYRGYEFYVLGTAQPQDFASSPLTLLVFGVLAGYYTMYAAGILRWRAAASTANYTPT